LKADALSMYLQFLTAEFLDPVQKKEKIRENNCVYTMKVVMWLMIAQRLQNNGSMDTAVLELLRGLPVSFWPRPCKRLKQQQEDKGSRLSDNTGSYNNARQKLPVSVVEQSCDRIFEQLIHYADGSLPAVEHRAFFFDGTSLRLPYNEELKELYPPGSNQHGESHWPLIRVLVAHDLKTGLAMRPQWGPLNGSKAASEQRLLEEAIDRLPSESTVVGDANFGVFSVAYAAVERGHPVLLRLTPARAKHLAGEQLKDGIDRHIEWRPSRDDRRSHPLLPPDACVRGRLVVCQVQPSDRSNPFLLCLFTTLDVDIEELSKLYGKRWYIETDLRTLKRTLRLDQLTCTTAEMVAKEIDLGMAAYNLVRGVAYLAAQKAGIPPRSYSFTRVRNVIHTFLPLIATAKGEREAEKLLDDMMYYVGRAQLPKRPKKRPSYPRAVWGSPQSFPNRKV
jgi:putative transposase